MNTISERIEYVILTDLATELSQLPSEKTCSAAQAYVSVDGSVVAHGHWGLRRLDPDEPNGPDTRMDIASVSKLFTATMAMSAIDYGLLSFESQIENF